MRDVVLIDTHCHINDAQFEADRPATIERARVAGVTTLVEIAESPATWEHALALADQHPLVYASLGIHPHHAHEANRDTWPALEEKLRRLLAHPKAVAVGEFGLDYFRMHNTREEQDFLFQAQLRLARDLGKPVVIHCRDAHADLQKRLIEFFPSTSTAMAGPPPVGVIHCFTGTWADAQTYLEHGFYLGIDAPVGYPSAKLLKENVQRLPLERIVLETDAPYLPPQLHRGQRNEPAYLRITAETIAALKSRTVEEVGRQTTRNAQALFRI